MSKRSRRKKERMLSMHAGQPSTSPEEKLPEQQHHTADGKKYSKIVQFYDKHYKQLLIIPLILIILSLAQIGWQAYATGDFIQKGVSLKGGVTVTIPTSEAIDVASLEISIRSQFPDIDLTTRTLESTGQIVGYVIEADLQDSADIEKALGIINSVTKIPRENYGLETIQPSLGESFFREAGKAILFSFILMSIVIFIAFRTFVPSLAVIVSVLADMIMTLAAVNLLGIKVSTAGIAAFLMLIGYSVDTDILLSSRVLKREEGTVFERILGSVKTGMTMVATALTAAIIAYFLSESETIRQIMLIIIIGLVADIFNTWITNTAILRWYVEKKARKHGKA